MDELTRRDAPLSNADMQSGTRAVSVVVREVMAPLMESIGRMLKQNTEALEQIAAAQQMTSERIAALERKVRLQTPVSKTQEKYINDAIRARARELLDGKGICERRAISQLGGIIRKSVLTRYGVGSLRECPAYDYDTILRQVGIWNDLIVLRGVVKEALAREEVHEEPTQSTSD